MKIKIVADDQGIRWSKDLSSLFRDEPIDDCQIALAMNLFFQNASELLEEAKILFEAKRYARAFSLAVLSLEELAKPVFLVNAIFFEKGDRDAWRALFKVLRSHESKQGLWSAYGKNLEQLRGPTTQNNLDYADRFPAGVAALLDRFKQAGFYVTYFSKGGFILPNKLATDNQKWIRRLIRFADRRIQKFSKLHGSRARAETVVRLSRLQSDQMPKELKQKLLNIIKTSLAEIIRDIRSGAG
jgi:AbiV family abortive infection protein